MESKRIVEINGVKVEVDLREAKTIDTFKVGDSVKVLTKGRYGDERKIFPGVIVGFEDFKSQPTVVIAYMEIEYSEATLKFAYLNGDSKGLDVVSSDDYYLPLKKGSLVDKFDAEIRKAEDNLAELNRKKEYFLSHFNRYFNGDKDE